jgi:hypothetical protein
MAETYLKFVQPMGGGEVYTERSIAGASSKGTGNAGRADVVLETQTHIYIWEVKPNNPNKVSQGRKQVQGYVDGIRREVKKKYGSQAKTVTVGFGLPTLIGPNIGNPKETIYARNTTAAGVYGYNYGKRTPGNYPGRPLVTFPVVQVEPSTVLNYVGATALAAAGAAAGAAATSGGYGGSGGGGFRFPSIPPIRGGGGAGSPYAFR